MAQIMANPKTYMIAVDHSPNSQYAFEEVSKMMDHERDLLYLITVAEYIPFYGSAMSAVVVTEAQKSSERRAETLLAEYVQMCRLVGIKNFKSLLGRGGHVGEVICRAVDEKEVNTLLIGRRGMGKIKRLFIGSTSRYCTEHANCTVVCVKLPPNHQPAPLPTSTIFYQPTQVHGTGHKAEAHEYKAVHDHTKYQPTHGISTKHEVFAIQDD